MFWSVPLELFLKFSLKSIACNYEKYLAIYVFNYIFIFTDKTSSQSFRLYVKVSLDYYCNNKENYEGALDHLSIDSQTDSLIQML